MVNNINSEAFVYRNMASEQGRGSWLGVKLAGKGGNTAAIGAKVYAYAGGKMQYAEINPARGYLSCMLAEAHFGFGKETTADSVVVIWPDQSRQKMTRVALNQKLVLKEEGTTPSVAAAGATPEPVFKAAPALIDYKPEGFGDNDFKRQLLMFFMYSRTGPVVARGDINKDGREDLFISGDKNRPGMLYVQQAGGKPEATGPGIGHEDSSTVAAATFFDANGDGWPDLYVAKGGYSLWEPHTAALQDELFLNDGKGGLYRQQGSLPDVSASSKSCVRPCDYDGDGDIDLFVGGRVVPGQYPQTPTSFLLTNDGKGHFTITSAPFDHIGMVTDAQWIDLNGDGRKDLIICGEFMPVMVYLNTTSGFVDKTADYFGPGGAKPGFWNTLTLADIDGDGKPDLIAGNLGLNSCIKLSPKEPAELFYADFDHNGSIDPFFNFYIQGVSYPFVSRDELNEQMYPMRKKFSSYKDYSNATMKDIFSKDELEKAGKLSATEEHTMCWLNKGDHFVPVDLPLQAQFAPVTQILAADFDKDGHTDLLLLGNHSDNRLKIGSIDANYGCLLKGDGKGSFRYVSQPASGLSVKGDVKSALDWTVDGKKYLVIGVAEGALQFYRQQ